MRLALIASLLLCGSVFASEPWEAAIKYRSKAPGRGVEGACLPFAEYMAKKIPGAEVVKFQITMHLVSGHTMSYWHAAVVWKVDKEIWMMDNFSLPIWAGNEGDDPEDVVAQFICVAYSLVGLPGGPIKVAPTGTKL